MTIGWPWEIAVGDVSEVEATVRVRYRGPASESVAICGAIRGPYCERAHTLPADYPFQALAGEIASAEAVVTDPCTWSKELPHLYRVDVAAMHGEAIDRRVSWRGRPAANQSDQEL